MQNKFVGLKPSQIILHPKHPAASLHPRVRERLLTGQTLPQSAIKHLVDAFPLTVTHVRKTWALLSGFRIWSSMRLLEIDSEVNCIHRQTSDSQIIRTLGLADLLYTELLFVDDEVCKRILARLALEHEQQQGYVSRRKLHSIKNAFRLPTRKRNTLGALLEDEDEAVWSFIMEASKPIGGKGKERDDIDPPQVQAGVKSMTDTDQPTQLSFFDHP